MAVTALTKFTQGSGATDSPGVAVVGTLTGVLLDDRVTVTNGDNTNVVSWSIDLLYAPPYSSLTPGNLGAASDNTPIATFDPDVPGCYRCKLSVSDSFGHTDVDIRNFAIRNFRGIISPPYQMNPVPIALALKPDELNFGGQLFGWAGAALTGMLETFFRTYADKVSVEVDSTPYAVDVDEADIYLMKPTTCGSAMVVNLPSALAIGRPVEVVDVEDDAATYNITVNAPGGHSFPGGSSVTINVDSGHVVVMRVAATTWAVLSWSAPSTDADAIHKSVSGEINALTEKTLAVVADLVVLEDSASSYAKKKAKLSTLRAMAVSEVSATPSNAASPGLYLVNTSTIGAPSTVNVTTGVGVGQVVCVKDNQEDAYTNNITVALPALHTFEDGGTSRKIWAKGGAVTLVRTGTTSWRLINNSCREVVIPLLGSAFTTSLTGYQRAADANIDNAKFPTNAVYLLEAILETTSASYAADARLWNVTDGSSVATFSSTSLTPELKTAVIVPASGEKIYEAQLKMNSGVSPDMVTMSQMRVRVIYASTG